jgi:hypothetical protein
MGLAPATEISETLHLATLAPYRVSLATKKVVDNHIGDIMRHQSHIDFIKRRNRDSISFELCFLHDISLLKSCDISISQLSYLTWLEKRNMHLLLGKHLVQSFGIARERSLKSCSKMRKGRNR